MGVFSWRQLIHQFKCVEIQHVWQLKFSAGFQFIFRELSTQCSVISAEVDRWRVHPASKFSFPALGSLLRFFPSWVCLPLSLTPRLPDVSSLIASTLSTISCSILARLCVCCPFPTQPGHPAVRLSARLPLPKTSFYWIVGFKNCKSTFQTSHTACLHCACWRQQQKFIGAVKLAGKNSSHPPHVQLGSVLRMVSPQAHFSKWHNLSSVVLAPPVPFT